MRYDDIEVHKSLVAENMELVELVNTTRKELDKESKYVFNQFGILITKFEKLAENSRNPFNWRSLKIMASFISIGLFFGALAVSGYAYYRIDRAEISALATNKKILHSIVTGFNNSRTAEQMKTHDYQMVGNGKNNFIIKINGYTFVKDDVINGWKFKRAEPMFMHVFFTNVANPEKIIELDMR